MRLAFQMFGEPHARAFVERLRQARLAFAKRQAALVLAAEERRVEDEVDDLGVAPGLKGVLQRLKARTPVAAQHHDLAVEPGVVEL